MAPATRRSGRKAPTIEASAPITKSTAAKARSNAAAKSNTMNTTPVPATKRRRINGNDSTLETPATPKHEEDPSTTVSTVDSGATSPAQEDTPLTSWSEFDSENEESELSDPDDDAYGGWSTEAQLEKFDASSRKLKRRKATVVLSDDDDEYVPEPKKAPKRRASGKAKEKIQTIVIEDSDEDIFGDESMGSAYEDDDLDSVETASAAPAQAAGGFIIDDDEDDVDDMPVLPQNSYNRRSRTRFPRILSRTDRDKERLYAMHPELRTCWETLDKLPKIDKVEDPQPDGLTLTLLPFQREGLHWLRAQEQTCFKGGILADEMGMGKTIQTISLLMSDPDVKPNLVVAPTVAIMQWKAEIEKHTGGHLTVCIHHGPSRLTDPEKIKDYHVILTTYNVLESDWRKQNTGFKRKDGLFKEDSILHSIEFHRTVLDEAHNIKDRSCNTAKAVYALKTKYKLCLSGTPLQNRIGELFSLLRFLEIDPFSYYYCRQCTCKQLHWKFSNGRHCDHCNHSPMQHVCFFNWALLKPIQRDGYTGDGAKALSQIHKLLNRIMLRRTKTEREEDLGLPPKIIKVRRDKFSEEEADLYESIFKDGQRKFNTYVAAGVVLNNYANIFTLITRLRQMANHPDLVLRKAISQGETDSHPVCPICVSPTVDAIKSKCHHIFCRDCISTYISSYPDGTPTCPTCHVAISIDLSQPELELTDQDGKKQSITSRIDHDKWRSSTKIEALCAELHKLRTASASPKSIVFSSFTSFLSLLDYRLHTAGFKTVLLSGSMTPAQRDASIKHFMNTPDVEVFLVSLKAGGVALNLIEANNVFIMEPWWNPAVQWQAADRIHRIGQKRLCRITYLCVEGSIEGRIMELQDKKRRLIESTVECDEKAVEKLSVGDMQFLFAN